MEPIHFFIPLEIKPNENRTPDQGTEIDGIFKEILNQQWLGEIEKTSSESLSMTAMVNMGRLLLDPEMIPPGNILNGLSSEQESGGAALANGIEASVQAPVSEISNLEESLLNPINNLRMGEHKPLAPALANGIEASAQAPVLEVSNREDILLNPILNVGMGEHHSLAPLLADGIEAQAQAPVLEVSNLEESLLNPILNVGMGEHHSLAPLLADGIEAQAQAPVSWVSNPKHIFFNNRSDAKPDQGWRILEFAPQADAPERLDSLPHRVSDQDRAFEAAFKNIQWEKTHGLLSEKNLLFPSSKEGASFAELSLFPREKETEMSWNPKIDQPLENQWIKNTALNEAAHLFEENGEFHLGPNPENLARGTLSLYSEGKAIESLSQERQGIKVVAVETGHSQDGASVLLGPNGDQKIISGFSDEVSNIQKPLPTKPSYGDIYQQVGYRVILGIRNNEDKIRFSLSPPQLGNLYVEISKDKESIKAVLWADHKVTKEILLAHETELHRMLREDGLKLEKFDVFCRQDMGWFYESEESPVKYPRWLWGHSLNDEGPLIQGESEVSPLPAHSSSERNRFIDVFI